MSNQSRKLTIRLPEEHIQFAKSYARQHGITVTEMIDRFFQIMQRNQNAASRNEIDKISGLVPEHIDAQEEYRQHILKKHT